MLIPAVVMWVFWLLGQDKGIPVILILLAVVVLVYNYFTSNTVPGRYLYAMGGNEKAARLSGVNTKRIQFFAYTNMGFLASVAALVCVSRFNSAAPSAGTNYEMDAIAACVVGGVSFTGGIGKISGVVTGVLIFTALTYSLTILGIDTNLQFIFEGIIILAAVTLDCLKYVKKK